MTPLQLLDAIEDGDARTPRGRRRIVLELTVPRVFGHQGRFLGEGQFGPRFGYTRTQARAIRKVIADAAAAESAPDPGP